MNPTALTVAGLADWLRLLAGTAVFLLPGLAAADRWLRGLPARWVWSPVLSFTLLALTAILLDFVADVDVTRTATFVVAIALAAAIARPRLQELLKHRRWRRVVSGPRPPWWSWVALGAVLPFLFVAHSLPHLDGAPPAQPSEVPATFWDRAVAAAAGEDDPYPVHVDEHLHIASMAAIERTGEVETPHPYTGEARAVPLFTVGGLRSERGWQVAIVQLHELTGASFPALAHFLPALWTAYLGLALWSTLWPAPGAAASAAFTAILPTTIRFLGPGFLVPSGFALPWILAVVAVAHRGRGPGRLVALALLITGGFFMHIVPGTIAFVAGLLTAAMRPGRVGERLGLAAAILLPLVWILPSSLQDIETAVTTLNHLPFETYIFGTIGLLVMAAAVVGTGAAWFGLRDVTVPHRVLSVLAFAAIASLAWSIDAQHSNDATYGRLIPTLFLCLAGLAGLGVGVVAAAAARLRPSRWPRWTAIAAMGFVVTPATVAVLLSPLQDRMQEPYYRIFDERSWQQVEDFAASGAGPDDVFLAHPWRAPLFSAVTGARPWAYLMPGAPPIHNDDFVHYRVSAGANATWLQEREIAYVADEAAPKAPYEQLAPDIYRIRTE